ncbi:DNA-directed RNA polymerase [Perilla frutescens var. hirtella]|uniref:DNA-directed RNA polymerase subunit n=1 Tax=Perilla frutescens var. hirtella TaxID=608512 RepID=A0AAD4JLJ9_PERFH|nr:DNA-directed RNA polymerase [Perilla frutescens var. frutescens]KAH6835686.1 DNA-directed RNA polymerase [Perilla frutescens var. hirtella]
MEFCPTCGNMLLYELPYMDRPARFSCPTCPYACQIETRVKIKRHVRLVKKPIDPIFSEDDRKNLNETSVPCPECNNDKASFTQVQTRSADEPMTVFYTCTKCRHTWTEN